MSLRILLTGATGFLGSHLAADFSASGHVVTVVVRPSSSTKRIAGILDRLKVCHASDLETAIPRSDVIVHAATCYGRRGETAEEMERANVLLPATMLLCAVHERVGAFINVDTTLPPQLNAYADSKARFANQARSIATEGTRFANVRLESLYGPGDDDTKFPTQAVRMCLANAPELAMTKGEQKRDYIYIEDAVAAFRLLVEQAPRQADIWCDYGLGTGHPVTIREFVETAKRESGSTTRLNFGALPYREGELMYSAADIGALRSLGWSPRVTLASGLRRMITAERSL